jgi:hypothetical protein
MKHFVSTLSNGVRHKFSIGLLILSIVGVVGGGSVYLSTQSVHAVAAGSTRGQHVAASYLASPALRLPRKALLRLAALAVSFRAPVHHTPAHHIAARQTPPPTRRVQVPARQTPPVTSTPAPSTGNSSSVEGMISQAFGPYAASALSVARCESGLNPGAYNASSHASGLFQILPSTWATTPFAGSSPFNAWANINAAHSIFVRDGYSWREWTCR